MIRKIRLRVEIREEIAALASLYRVHSHCDLAISSLCSKKENNQLRRTREILAEKIEEIKPPFHEAMKRLKPLLKVAQTFQTQDTSVAVREIFGFQGFQVEFDLRELFREYDEEAIELFFLVSTLTNGPALFDTHVVLGGRLSEPVYLLALLYHYARRFGYLEDDADEDDGFFFEEEPEDGMGGDEALSEVARFFLHYVSLSWPCTPQDLRRAYKQAVYQSHPDRNPQDRSALARTQMLNAGYSELLAVCEANAAA